MPTLREEIGLLHHQFEQVLRGRERRERLPPLLAGPVLRAAVQMELALLRGIRVHRPRPPERQNAWYAHRILRLLPLYLLLLVLFVSLQVAFPRVEFWIFASYALSVFLLTAGMDVLFARKLVVVAGELTEDAPLDAMLEGMQEPAWLGWRWLLFRRRRPASVQEYERNAPHRYAYLMSLSRRLSVPEQASDTRVQGDGQDDAWEALKGRLLAMLVEGQAPDAQITALLLLATVPEMHRFRRLPRADAALYRLLAPEERQRAHARLTQLLKAAPVMTQQLDPALYDTLLFLRDQAFEQIKTQPPAATLGGHLSRVFTG
jgi:hypothetical protein